MLVLFDLCGNENIIHIFAIIKEFLKIIRYVVPIGLVILTTVDIFKKTINPDDKDGQRKIITRIIATILVFFTPVLVRFVLKVVDVGLGSSHENDAGGCVSSWNRASL